MKRKTMTRTIALRMAAFGIALMAVGCTPKGPHTYYIDPDNGDDRNNGLSEAKAWRTLQRADSLLLEAGESLLLKRGATFQGPVTLLAEGTAGAGATIDAYGQGAAPVIDGCDSPTALTLLNPRYLTVQNLEITNHGDERLPGRCGLELLADDAGECPGVNVRSLYIHDVNGTLAKFSGEGCGIRVRKMSRDSVGYFRDLLIENCVIRRTERNGINWGGSSNRNNGHPDINTVIRYNLLEEVPGDGIVPIGCDSTLMEYNLMRACTDLLPDDDAAAGFWPWNCDNTIIQFNEVSDHHAPWDGQGFDSDYNCTNTTIQYNYSHDNDGGFLLVCTPSYGEGTHNIGNMGVKIIGNISLNDGLRTRTTRDGMFSPIIHVAGPAVDVEITHNILVMGGKATKEVDTDMITFSSWDEYCNDGAKIIDNIFYSVPKSVINMRDAKGNTFSGNYYLGNMVAPKFDKTAKKSLPGIDLSNANPAELVQSLLMKRPIADGRAQVTVVNQSLLDEAFYQLQLHATGK